MFRSLREFIETRLPPAGRAADESSREHTIRLTTAALLLETMRADYDEDDHERGAIVRLMKTVFGLDEDETAELLRQAEGHIAEATSLYDFTRLINDTHDPEQKIRIIELMWDVAFADGRVDKYEDHLIRKVADLIHVLHSEFMRAKLRAEARSRD